MTVYTIAQNVSAAQTTPGNSQNVNIGGNLPVGSTAVLVTGGAGVQQSTPPVNQTYQVIVTSAGGTVTCTFQPLVSNDGINWSNYGNTITASGTTPQVVTGSGAQVWAYYSGWFSAISGTGKCLINI